MAAPLAKATEMTRAAIVIADADPDSTDARTWSSARVLTYSMLWLETRRINTRAVGFYARHGYQPIPNYGKYAGRAEAICLGKTLAATAGLGQTD